MGVHKVHELLKRVGLGDGIGIQEEHVTTLCELEGLIVRRGEPAIFGVSNQVYVWKLLPDRIRAVVLRGIIHHPHLG